VVTYFVENALSSWVTTDKVSVCKGFTMVPYGYYANGTLPAVKRVTKRAVKGSQRGKREPWFLDVGSDSVLSERQSGCMPEQKQPKPPGDSPVFAESTGFSVPASGYNGADADDFLVGVIGSREDAEQLKQDLTVFLKEKLGFTLSAEKTKITSTANCARFLSYDIYVSHSQSIKRLKIGRYETP